MRTFISHDQSPIEIDLESPLLIVADPAALEGLPSVLLPESKNLTHSALVSSVSKLRSGFRVYVHPIPRFSPGTYRITFADIIAVDDETPGSSATVDSGSLVFFDYAKHDAVLKNLSWESYDLGLQDATGVRFDEITRKIGSRCYAIMFGNADADGDFGGDGSYALRPSSPKKAG